MAKNDGVSEKAAKHPLHVLNTDDNTAPMTGAERANAPENLHPNVPAPQARKPGKKGA